MPFIPFAASVGAALGTSAGIGGAVVAGTALKVGMDIVGANKQAKASKNAANDASVVNTAAIQTVKDAQGSASNNAQATILARKRTASQSVYTSPLGLSDTASTAKKSLLGQ